MERTSQESADIALREGPCGVAGVAGLGARYHGFLAGAFAYYAANLAWGACEELGRSGPMHAVAAFFFLSLAAFPFLWGRFAVSSLGLGKWPERILLWSGLALLAFTAAALAATPFNGGLWQFDAMGGVRPGPLRNPAFGLAVAYDVLVAAFVFAKGRGSREDEDVSRKSRMFFLFGIALSLGMATQAVWPPAPFSVFSCFLASCFFHASVVGEAQAEKHEEELEKALARARTAEKTRSMFFGIVSHDIRTPLNAILGYSELLTSGIESPAGRKEALDAIQSSGTTLLQLVNDVLDLAKMDAGKMTLRPEPVRLSRLTDEVFASFRLAADGKQTALVNQTAEVPPVLLDGHRFRQILFNLVGNAVKFTDRGTVTVAAARTGTGLEVTVADTGCGIPPGMLSHILDPFVQVEDASHMADRQKGSGLGLAICKGMVQVMGGELAVESTPGKGSAFHVRLPDVATAAEEPAPAAVPAPVAAPKKLPERVLVVDDSPVNRKVLAAFLKKAGIAAVDHAADGVEALAKLGAALEAGLPHDFVFSDFWMPAMNGLEFVEKLRGDARFEGLPVFAVTADTEARHDARSGLFTGILVKPLTYVKLMEAFSM